MTLTLELYVKGRDKLILHPAKPFCPENFTLLLHD